MSRAAHSRPFVSHPGDVNRCYAAVQLPGGAYVVQSAVYDEEDATWNLFAPVEALSAARVSALTAGLYWQPDILEPSLGIDDENRLWLIAADDAGTHLMARSTLLGAGGEVYEDWSQNPSRPFSKTRIRFPKLYRLWGTLFLSCDVLIKNDGDEPGDWGWGLARWSSVNQAWTPIGGITGTEASIPCLVWLPEGAGASRSQWRVLSMWPGNGQDQVHIAWVWQRDSDPIEGWGSEVHYAFTPDLFNNLETADGAAIAALPVATGTQTVIATDLNNKFNKIVSVSTQITGQPVIFVVRDSEARKGCYVFAAGTWTYTDFGVERGSTPNRGFVFSADDTVILPDNNGYWLSGAAAGGYTAESAWAFVDVAAEGMGSLLNYSLDEEFFARTGWVRWSSAKVVSDGGTTNAVIVSEANPFGAPDYRNVVYAAPSLSYGSPLEVWGTLS